MEFKIPRYFYNYGHPYRNFPMLRADCGCSSCPLSSLSHCELASLCGITRTLKYIGYRYNSFKSLYNSFFFAGFYFSFNNCQSSILPSKYIDSHLIRTSYHLFSKIVNTSTGIQAGWASLRFSRLYSRQR